MRTILALSMAASTSSHHLLFSQHLVNYCFFCLYRHLVTSDEFKCFFRYKPVDLLALFAHQLLNIDLFIAEPPQVISDQVQVLASLAPYQHHAHFIGVLGKRPPLSMLAYVACEHDHKEPCPVSGHSLDITGVNCHGKCEG